MKTIKRTVLALFCVGLFMGTTSCNRSSGCGTWGQAKTNKNEYWMKIKNNNQHQSYKKYNS